MVLSAVQDTKAKKSPCTSASFTILSGLLECLVGLFFLLFALTWTLQYAYHTYGVPQLHNLNWEPIIDVENNLVVLNKEASYYHRHCTRHEQTAHSTDELILDPAHHTSSLAADQILLHGAGVFPEAVPASTAMKLRDYILQHREAKDGVFSGIIQPEKRATWGFTPNEDPIVQEFLHELWTHNPLLKNTLEELLGNDPAIVEFNHITSSYGAVAQHWHSDTGHVVASTQYIRNSMPSYSLFVPLQNTTASMGATSICPGSHMCSSGPRLYCQNDGFQLFQENQEGWPQGWAFVYNNVMQHRGAAHIDPHAPDRALLIMTLTSRPRHSVPRFVETRFIPDHFFNQWFQWGHTLSDFGKPQHYMKEPFQTLRSLGIYKPNHRNWGWDLTSFYLQLIQNADHDESVGGSQLQNFLTTYSWLEQLPDALKGERDDGLDMKEQWLYYFRTLLEKWNRMAAIGYASALSLYLLSGLLRWWKSKPGTRASFLRLILFHVVVAGLLYAKRVSLEKTSWARNIKRNILYSVQGPMGPELPGTLPLRNDVLVTGEEFSSEYLGAHRRLLDQAHPGNRRWRTMLLNHSQGYHQLRSQLRYTLAENLVHWNLETQSRILVKNLNGEWADPGLLRAIDYAQKELTRASSPVAGYIVTWIDYMLAESRYGYWRDASMSLNVIPTLLLGLQERIINYVNQPEAGKEQRRINSKQSFSCPSKLPKLNLSEKQYSGRSPFPARLPVEEPFPGAWMKEGDRCEGNMEGRTDGTYESCLIFFSFYSRISPTSKNGLSE